MKLRLPSAIGLRPAVVTACMVARLITAATATAAMIPFALAAASAGRAASFLSTDQIGSDPAHPIVFYGVSGDGGTAVGYRVVGGEAGNEAIRWRADEGIVSLGRLPGGSSEGYARAASYDGSTIVGMGDTVVDIPGPGGEPFLRTLAAFAWRSGIGMQGLDGDRSDAEFVLPTTAASVSADGRTVVGSRRVGILDDPESGLDAYDYEAVVWREGQAPRLLGSLETVRSPWFQVDHGSFATDVSGDGSIVVGTTDSNDGREAFVWDEVRGMRGLGRFPSDPFSYSGATAISDDGTTIVGNNFFEDPSSAERRGEGFIYTEAAGLQRIPGLTERWPDVVVADVSGDGSIVVGTGFATLATLDPLAEGEAFVWDAEHGVRTLKEVLASLGVALPGWRLSSASSISQDGRTLVGYGLDPGGTFQSFIAVIPEPATGVLVGAGLVALAWRGRPGRPGSDAGGREVRAPGRSPGARVDRSVVSGGAGKRA